MTILPEQYRKLVKPVVSSADSIKKCQFTTDTLKLIKPQQEILDILYKQKNVSFQLGAGKGKSFIAMAFLAKP